MRTDVEVHTTRIIRVPQIPLHSVGRPAYVTRGDFITYRENEHITRNARVIGVVTNRDDNKEYLCVVAQWLSGMLTERWVDPDMVVDTHAGSRNGADFSGKAAWFYSDEFHDTPVDAQRQVYELTIDQLTSAQLA